eukprot:3179167-Lingulodinium_polyedra.AAC.1
MGDELRVDERNRFFVGCRNSVGARRQEWQAMCVKEQREAMKGPTCEAHIRAHRQKVEAEVQG